MPVTPLTMRIELAGLDALLGQAEEEVKAALRRGALTGAQFAQGLWIRAAQAANVRRTGAYIRGIQSEGSIRTVSESESQEGWEMVIEVVNTAPHASLVEEGHAAFHLPSVVNWSSSRVKTAKDGTKYLSIPFGHTAFASAEAREAGGYTTGAIKAMMPEHIYQEAKRLAVTRRLRQGPVRSPNGQFLQADKYAYGGRLDRSGTRPGIVMGGPGVSAGGPGEPGFEEHRGIRQVGRDAKGNALINPAWQSSKFAGMMRSGSPGRSSYTTIRTMTDRSLGWNIPAMAGQFIAAKVATILSTDQRFADAVVQSIAAVVTPSGGEP